MTHTRRVYRDLAVLSALCGLIYFLFPTSHGLTNWQEAMRALVAREMHARIESGERWAWLVPTVWGEPYLAKPPVIYWCQLLLARFTGGPPTELHLRLTVAIAGWLGVLGVYGLARSMLRDWRSLRNPAADFMGVRSPDSADSADPWPDHVAWWSAMFLATGVLYVRSSRIGELDILLVPTTIGAVWAIVRAWRTVVERGRVDYPRLALAALLATVAALTKGPPALLVIGLAGYGGMILWAAFSAEAVGPAAPGQGASPRRPARDWIYRLAGVSVGLAVVAAGALRRWTLNEMIGLGFFAAAGLSAAVLLARFTERGRALSLWNLFKQTHPVGVLAAPALIFWAWGRVVAGLVGQTTVSAAAAEEAADNLRVLVADSPMNNLEAAAYGVGLGSVAAIIFAIWIIKDRPLFNRGWFIAVAWAGMGLVAFSVLGKGVPRYLTPLWPGLAILGGMWFTSAVRDVRAGPGLARAALIATLILGLGQGWWYAYGRERHYPDRSPRAFMRELAPAIDEPAGEPLATFEFSTPAIDYYAGRAVESFHDVVPRKNLRMVGPRTIADLRQDLVAGLGGARSCVLLIRRTQPGGQEPKRAVDCLREAGFTVEPIAMTAVFTIDNGRVEVDAVRVRAAEEPPVSLGTASPRGPIMSARTTSRDRGC